MFRPRAAIATPMSIKPTPSGRLALGGKPTSPVSSSTATPPRATAIPTILAVWSGSSSSSQCAQKAVPSGTRAMSRPPIPAERCCSDSVKKKVGIAILTTPRMAPSRHTGRSRGISPLTSSHTNTRTVASVNLAARSKNGGTPASSAARVATVPVPHPNPASTMANQIIPAALPPGFVNRAAFRPRSSACPVASPPGSLNRAAFGRAHFCWS